MPGFDQTGPRGEGPMTGRGAGVCDVPLTRKRQERSGFSNIYCSNPKCMGTRKHEKVGNQWRCMGCGTLKDVRGTFEDRLKRALGLLSEDKAIRFKHEGLAKKASKGAHKFDSPPEYFQLKYDGKWGSKADRSKLNS
jgi:hypothetical protein